MKKLLTIMFDESVDLSNFPVEKTGVSITDGTNAVPGGAILHVGNLAEIPQEIPEHSHPLELDGSVGPPIHS